MSRMMRRPLVPELVATNRILVADDEPDLAFLVRMVLEGAGYEVIEARDGLRALERIAEAVPRLVITDLMMPRMNGRTLIDRLRSDPTTTAVPIVMLSSNPDLASDADAFVTKPFVPQELLELVQRLLTATAHTHEGESS